MMARRVVVVMPPATDLTPASALDLWPTFTKVLEALRAAGEVEPVGCCRTRGEAAVVERNGVRYFFEPDDRQLARRVAALQPAVVHIHGLGFTRLLAGIRHAVGRSVPILLQHHGEPAPTTLRTRIARRLTRHMVDGYLFTGADGQAEPFRRAGVIARNARVHEVLESASDLEGIALADLPRLGGSPSVLWVGRLIASKDPLCAVRAIATARDRGSRAELHMLATDRSMEPEVRDAIGALDVGDAVHIHPPVEHSAMPGWYSGADVYMSTSHHEGSNYSLIEALGFGCYPVVTAIPSHEAIVKGLVRMFAVGDSDGAAALISDPPEKSRKVVVEHALHSLSWSTIADQLAEIYSGSRRA
jgi:glycosyltransferase involved in cell wall biosynthesis